MESLVNRKFWDKRRVLITGHTGFKGAWLALWLERLGAEITGYSLEPPTEPNLYELTSLSGKIADVRGDIRDFRKVKTVLESRRPEIVFHLAAQSLVRQSYLDPIETYATNVMGTLNLLEGARQVEGIKAFVNVTSDKCYQNREWVWGYRENDPMGGKDPYSSSKGCSELVTSAYRESYFNSGHFDAHRVALASARAGNVIGGGDWGRDRLVPDCIKALLESETIRIRNPKSIRPWQHVLEPLYGYLVLAEKLFREGIRYSQGWNFGPPAHESKSVEWVVRKLCEKWGSNSGYEVVVTPQPPEAISLKLDCSKSISELGWTPKWSVETAIEKTVEWAKGFRDNRDINDICRKQIEEYESAQIAF